MRGEFWKKKGSLRIVPNPISDANTRPWGQSLGCGTTQEHWQNSGLHGSSRRRWFFPPAKRSTFVYSMSHIIGKLMHQQLSKFLLSVNYFSASYVISSEQCVTNLRNKALISSCLLRTSSIGDQPQWVSWLLISASAMTTVTTTGVALKRLLCIVG